MGLRDLANEMFDTLRDQNRSKLLSKAYETLPKVTAVLCNPCENA